MNEDKVIALLLKHDKDIEDMKVYLKEEVATKNEIREIQKTLDTFLGMMHKRDQEMTFLQYRTQENTEDIKQIKSFVKFK